MTATLVEPLHDTLRKILWMAREEHVSAPFAWREKLHWWPRGFLAESARLYDLAQKNTHDYVTDYARRHRFRKINPVPAIFDHKLLMRAALLQAGFAQAETVATIAPGHVQFAPFSDGRRSMTTTELHDWLLQDGGPFVIKPESSTRGQGVAILERDGAALVQRRGRDVRPARLETTSGIRIVERMLVQGPFWNRLNPSSANSIRIVTMWTPGDPAPFVGMAVQRIGTAATAPTDNFSGGGVCAPVDLETGRLGPGRRKPEHGGGAHTLYTHHPDTGAAIEGELIPAWAAICDVVLRATQALPYIRYAGWDVLVDDTGTPVIIEGNNNTDVNLFQVHGGLLRDARVRRFYERCGVL
jgi:hypothetical protein